MTISLRADISGTSGAIQVGGVDKVTINSSGQVAATSFSGDGSALTNTLPTQTGNSGKYLTTNGTTASWGTLDFTSSIASAGYQKLPGGLIIQWGTTSSAAPGATTSATLPLTFPNAGLQAVIVPGTAGANCYIDGVTLTTTTVSGRVDGSGTSIGRFIAIGY